MLPPDPTIGSPAAALGAIALGVALLKESPAKPTSIALKARAEQCDWRPRHNPERPPQYLPHLARRSIPRHPPLLLIYAGGCKAKRPGQFAKKAALIVRPL
jgi:hypothetical protein